MPIPRRSLSGEPRGLVSATEAEGAAAHVATRLPTASTATAVPNRVCMTATLGFVGLVVVDVTGGATQYHRFLVALGLRPADLVMWSRFVGNCMDSFGPRRHPMAIDDAL